jgi:zinc metalloprotease ZmpB
MVQEFDPKGKVHLTRDSQGTTRGVLHVEEQYETAASTAVLAAREYLEKFGEVLGIAQSELTNFSLAPETSPVDARVEYRFHQEKPQFDTTTVVLAQTYFGLPVWEAGVAVHMRQRPFVVLSAQSTRHVSVEAEMPSEKALARIKELDPSTLARQLGLAPPKKGPATRSKQEDQSATALTIKRRRLVVFQYDEKKRTPPDEPETQVQPSPRPSLPLPPVGPEIRQGRHYVASEIIFSLTWRNIEDLPWIAIIDVESLSVLYLRAFVDNVTGLVFKEDPITTNNGPLPNATEAQLNPLRSSALLPDLVPPVAGVYSLIGDRVQVVDVELPAVPPPTSPAGTNFDFGARTNNFAAVNAYYHCDRFFQLVEELGFDLDTYFTGTVSRQSSIIVAASAPSTVSRSTPTAWATGRSALGARHSCSPT